jgi:hypothetical protein
VAARQEMRMRRFKVVLRVVRVRYRPGAKALDRFGRQGRRTRPLPDTAECLEAARKRAAEPTRGPVQVGASAFDSEHLNEAAAPIAQRNLSAGRSLRWGEAGAHRGPAVVPDAALRVPRQIVASPDDHWIGDRMTMLGKALSR